MEPARTGRRSPRARTSIARRRRADAGASGGRYSLGLALRLHNTLSGQVETFTSIKHGEVTFYSCGPTVYDFAHIGNFRSFLNADVLRRWLESPLCEREDGGKGYRVTQVMNITDVGH